MKFVTFFKKINNKLFKNRPKNHSDLIKEANDKIDKIIITASSSDVKEPSALDEKNIHKEKKIETKKNKHKNISKAEVKVEDINSKNEVNQIENSETPKKQITNLPAVIDKQELLLEEQYRKLTESLKYLESNPVLPKKKSFFKSIFSAIAKVPKIFKFKYLFSIKVIVTIVLFLACFLVYILWNIPDYKVLEEYSPNTITRVYTSDGPILSELGIQNRSITPIDDIPQILKDAFISAEDKTFYSNWGFDIKGIARAALNDFLKLFYKDKTLMGASTITQQVVKNLLLNHDRTLIRKAKEAILTIKLEQKLSKDRILELYLNEIYLGMSSYGVTTAALNYFNKSLNELTIPEVAFLAILARSPNGYNPTTNYNGAKIRRDWVINRMLQDNKITKEQAEESIQTPIVIVKKSKVLVDISSYAAEEVRKQLFNTITSEVVYSKGLIVKTTINNSLQQYAYDALRKGIQKVDNINGYRGPIVNLLTDKKPTTETKDSGANNDNTYNNASINSLDENTNNPVWLNLLSDYSNKDIIKNIDNWNVAIVIQVNKDNVLFGMLNKDVGTLNLKDNRWAFPNNESYKLDLNIKTLSDFNNILKVGDIIYVEKNNIHDKALYNLRQIPKVNGSMVVMNPINGHILAMQGGFSYQLSQFNRAVQAERQIGSSFKPFVYLAALQKGMMPSTLVLDAPYISETVDGIWRPKNDSNRYAGYVTMRNALEHSRNLATIRIANFAGLSNISFLSKKLGIYNSDVTNFSEVIGSKESSLIKMVTAYSTIANGGKKVNPIIINEIFDRNGKVVFKDDKRECVNCNNVAWNDQAVPSIADNRETLIDPRDNYLLINMLEGVIKSGTAWRGKIPGYDIAGKTGTTNENKDLWFFGFTPQLVVGIYIGEDSPASLNPANTSVYVVPIFKDFASKALPLLFDKLPFIIPEGIEMKWINKETGDMVLLPDTKSSFLESFRSDNMPKGGNNINTIDGNSQQDQDNNEYGIY